MKTNALDKEELRTTINIFKNGRSANDIPTEYIQATSENNENLGNTCNTDIVGAFQVSVNMERFFKRKIIGFQGLQRIANRIINV